MVFQHVAYDDLQAPQKERYNYQKLAGVLADYGFNCIGLSDDWNGADVLAVHTSGETLRVQLKSRVWVMDKYRGNGLYLACPSAPAGRGRYGTGPDRQRWYLVPHDELLTAFVAYRQEQGQEDLFTTREWTTKRSWSGPNAPRWLIARIERYLLTPAE